ncbi:TetR family transcriptional regulator [Branchiibius hedensis]|uniref:Tetracyclin repressor, C-terminal all-alpha domain n=1 Tax=Branchiibius hedensis TaxID=672460 RepID=A0A2Y8ZRN3_9MICO|nr:TetR/AcrR family transcriptional regulator [Branchiibius hedensis]PWJ25173.1 TetR family transcriptional regulator [Branchiibius hedensis]SSA33988.1 Tetracyclin repressor, C-terminal all-alpha domain [Branchiibius hedensis]
MTARTPLSRERIIAAAIDVADEAGLEAVSMRSVATALGVVPMALYKHVGDKDDLIDGMVAAIVTRFGQDPATPAGTWQEEFAIVVRRARAQVTQRPWVRRAIETRTLLTPAVLGHMETLTQIMLRGGLSPDLTHHAMHALGNRIWGFSPELFNEHPHASVSARSTAPSPDPADYPGILQVAAEARRLRPEATSCDEDFEFDFTLTLLLDAIARLQEQTWTSQGSM